MALLLLKLIFYALSSLASLATFVVFRVFALLVLVFIQLLRVPGRAVEQALELIASLLRAGVEYVFEIIKDGLVSFIASAVELVSGAATGSIAGTVSGVVETAEKMKSALDLLAELFPEVFDGASEVVWKVVLDVWENYKDAVSYVAGNV